MLRGLPPLPEHPLNPYDLGGLRYDVLQFCAIFLLYGVHVALSLAAVPILARKEGRIWPLTTALGILFLSSTLATAIRFPMTWDVFGWDPDRAARTAFMFLVLSCVNYLISDMLVVWRAWVIWPDSMVVRGLLVASMSCSLAGTLFELVSQTASYTWIAYGLPVACMASTLCLTNVIATLLIGIRYWIYRREVAAWLSPHSTGAQVGGVLLLLLESGVAYTALWAINIFIQVQETLEHHWDFATRYEIMHETFYLCAGIYPTFVVVIIMLQQQASAKSALDHPSSFLESMHFALSCGEPPQESGRPSEDERLFCDSPSSLTPTSGLFSPTCGSSSPTSHSFSPTSSSVSPTNRSFAPMSDSSSPSRSSFTPPRTSCACSDEIAVTPRSHAHGERSETNEKEMTHDFR